jgi:hypothetical protein
MNLYLSQYQKVGVVALLKNIAPKYRPFDETCSETGVILYAAISCLPVFDKELNSEVEKTLDAITRYLEIDREDAERITANAKGDDSHNQPISISDYKGSELYEIEECGG